MQLSFWTYEGPAHVGAMRIAASLRGVHYVLHAPQGDTYADLLFTMIERHDRRPPVTYTTFAQRDLGGDTADLFRAALHDTVARHAPDLVLVGASCTGELIQDDPAGLSRGIGVPVVAFAIFRFGWRAGYVQMAIDVAIVASALSVVSPGLVLLSAAGGVLLNLVLSVNHRPGRYLGA